MTLDNKTLILVRHAHRDTSHKEADNGLSAKGKDQAETLSKQIQRIYGVSQATFLSSPKRRCIETLEPLCQAFESTVQSDPLLDEQQDSETSFKFRQRIQTFLERWIKGKDPFIFACSHGDWLPIAVELLTGAHSEFDKGGWAQVNWIRNDAIINFKN
jgi:phosphohistidine phosphatase SixA